MVGHLAFSIKIKKKPLAPAKLGKQTTQTKTTKTQHNHKQNTRQVLERRWKRWDSETSEAPSVVELLQEATQQSWLDLTLQLWNKCIGISNLCFHKSAHHQHEAKSTTPLFSYFCMHGCSGHSSTFTCGKSLHKERTPQPWSITLSRKAFQDNAILAVMKPCVEQVGTCENASDTSSVTRTASLLKVLCIPCLDP